MKTRNVAYKTIIVGASPFGYVQGSRESSKMKRVQAVFMIEFAELAEKVKANSATEDDLHRVAELWRMLPRQFRRKMRVEAAALLAEIRGQ